MARVDPALAFEIAGWRCRPAIVRESVLKKKAARRKWALEAAAAAAPVENSYSVKRHIPQSARFQLVAMGQASVLAPESKDLLWGRGL